MGSELSMRSKAEVTSRYAKDYVKARKKDKGRVLDEVVSVTGWSRDNARRRLTAAAKATDAIGGVSSTKPSPLLRSSITVRRAGDEVEDEPGFFEGDTVAHCGPTLKGWFARTVNLTDVRTGWVFTRSIRNNAHTHILSALHAGIDGIPYAVTGLDFDNGS